MINQNVSPYFVALEMLPQTGGPFKSVGLFRKALCGRVLSLTSNQDAVDKTDVEGFSYVYSPQLHYIAGRARRQMEKSLESASLISCHSIFRGHNQLCRSVARRRNIPYWSVPHGGMDPWVFTYGRAQKLIWYNLVGKNYFKDARFVILATERERDKMAERYGGDNMRVVYWPVEAIETADKDSVRASLRKKLGIDPESRIMLYFGRYHSMKRPLETIQCFKNSCLSDGTHLVMAGIDYDVTREQLQYEAGDLNDKQIHVLGPVYGQERLQLLIASDAYISLSIRENFNHTAAEAMSAGLALILSPGNDLQYSFPNTQQFGWGLASDGVDESIAAIESFDSCDTSRLLDMGECGKRWSQTELSFERFRDRLTNLYKESI